MKVKLLRAKLLRVSQYIPEFGETYGPRALIILHGPVQRSTSLFLERLISPIRAQKEITKPGACYPKTGKSYDSQH